jgi:hypothetical protein
LQLELRETSESISQGIRLMDASSNYHNNAGNCGGASSSSGIPRSNDTARIPDNNTPISNTSEQTHTKRPIPTASSAFKSSHQFSIQVQLKPTTKKWNGTTKSQLTLPRPTQHCLG